MYVLSGSFLGMIGLYLANNQKAVQSSQLSNFAFLLSLAGTFGAQLFHHFIQDPTLMRSLMRHQYGDVSNKIMSKYFFVTTLFTGIGSCLFLQAHPFPTWHGDVRLFVNSRKFYFLFRQFFCVQSIRQDYNFLFDRETWFWVHFC
jgi:hypothetical protein